MSVTLRLLVLTSLGLVACSGGDGSDDAPEESSGQSPSPAGPMSDPGMRGGTSPAPSTTNEGTPDVTGLDETTAPRGAANGREDDEAAGETTTSPPAAELPNSELCETVADWDPAWVAFEEEVLELVNEARSQPADCGVEGEFDAVSPLTMNPILRCSARLHSLDMYERNYFAHDTPDGVDPAERMMVAGFEGRLLGENIAQGQQTPEEVMAAWMDSDGHCANIMRPEYTLIGVGYSPGAPVRQGKSDFWTQNFGAPFASRPRR